MMAPRTRRTTKTHSVAAAAQPRRKRSTIKPPPPQPSGVLVRALPEELRLSRDEQVSESTVYSCIRNIAGPLSAAKWVPVVRSNGRRESLGDGNLFYLLNVWPNNDQTPSAVKHALITSALIYGNGYLAINRNDAEQVESLWHLETARVTPVRDPATTALWFLYRPPEGGEVLIPGKDIVHLPGPTFNGIGGDSLVERASPSISLAVAQAKFAQSFFANAGVITGYLKFSSAVTDPAVIEQIKTEWAAKFGGRRAHGIGVLSGGEFVSVSTDAEKAQLNDSRTQSVQDIARVFKVPLVLLSLAISAQGYGTNTTQFFEMFVRSCLHEWKVQIEEEVTRKLCAQRAPWAEIEIGLAHLTRGNEAEIATTNATLLASGQLTINECRARLNENAIEGGDVLLINGVPLDRVLNPPAPPAPPAPPEPEEDEEDTEEQPQEVTALRAAGLALALDNHRRRWVARTKNIPEEKHTAAREGLRASLAKDMAAFGKHLTDDQFASLATQVEAGVEPLKAIELLGQ